eukprot:11859647-Alexandrium_andersonii.AAC.1
MYGYNASARPALDYGPSCGPLLLRVCCGAAPLLLWFHVCPRRGAVARGVLHLQPPFAAAVAGGRLEGGLEEVKRLFGSALGVGTGQADL